jgi:hypothetical protein
MPETFSKRQKARDRQDRQRAKVERRNERRNEKPQEPRTPGEDPDLAGIIPGPQPQLDDGQSA